MATLRDIRTRIKSVKNTQKITAAMKLVAAAKLRRAQDAIVQARPYAVELGGLLRRTATRIDGEAEVAGHPLLREVSETRRVMLVVLTSDRGLCGAFNANVLRRAEGFVQEWKSTYEKLDVVTVGRKARDHFQKHNLITLRDFPGLFQGLHFGSAVKLGEMIAKEYVEGDLDAVYVMYSEFHSAMSQEVRLERILPVVRDELPLHSAPQCMYEPSRDDVLNDLAPKYMATLVWRALLESSASEQGARMTAMEAASKNAKEMIRKLSLKYNRARQANITRDLMDIVGGAEALSS